MYFAVYSINFDRLDFQTNKFAPNQPSNDENVVTLDVTRLFYWYFSINVFWDFVTLYRLKLFRKFV